MDWTPVYVGGSVVANWLILYLWQPWGQAYAGEKGKNLARKEDLDTILAEVRAITITQKEIEARLAGDLWSHQMIWNQKKEIYGELIKAALEMQNGYQAIRSMMAVNAEVAAMHKRWAETGPAYSAFSRSAALANIFAGHQSTNAIRIFVAEHSAPSPLSPQWLEAESDKIDTLLAVLIDAAKVDLGIA
jgi:hypothetical protein